MTDILRNAKLYSLLGVGRLGNWRGIIRNEVEKSAKEGIWGI